MYEIKMESVETSELKTGTYEVVGWAGKKYTVKYDHEQDKGWFQMPYSKLKASSTTFKSLKQVAIINK